MTYLNPSEQEDFPVARSILQPGPDETLTVEPRLCASEKDYTDAHLVTNHPNPILQDLGYRIIWKVVKRVVVVAGVVTLLFHLLLG